jgi:N6-adenosine-specific RNA methylase IME4
VRGKACSVEFMRRIEKMVHAAGGLEDATKRGALRPIIRAISGQTCLKENTVYKLIRTLSLEKDVQKVICGTANNLDEKPWPTILAECLQAPDPVTLARKAFEEEWTAEQTRAEALRRRGLASQASHGQHPGGRASDLVALAKSGRTFGTIYADPPWLYDNQATRAAMGDHYRGLTVEAICALPVGSLAAPDAHLHLWTTNAFLFDAPKIFAAWGFEFRSSFVWVKPQMGIGNYWRNSHELLLTAIRGDAKRFHDKNLMSWAAFRRGRHSAKPEKVRHFIERASPGPYLELFGRREVKGWIVWGDQIVNSLFDQGEVA